MIFSIGLILFVGYLAGRLFAKIRIPGLVGMIAVGFLFGPYCLSLLDPTVLQISAQLRQIALVIILTRSGLNLDFASLKKVGRPAVLMCFVPASAEMLGVTVAAHYLLRLGWFEGMLLGAVLAAVSPAVVSPRMIGLIERGLGEKHAVPKLVLAGSSVDDVYVIVAFYAFLGLVQSNALQVTSFLLIPVSILLGVALGCIVGIPLAFFYKRTNLPLAANVLILLSLSFGMIGVEELLKPWVSVSSLVGIMAAGMILLFVAADKAKEISRGYNALWTFFEVLLFVLVGAEVNFAYLADCGLAALAVLAVGLCMRTLGVFLCLVATELTKKERLFAAIAYLPKATVQASIGGIALSAGLSCGNVVLVVSVLAIVVTAPLGAWLIDTLAPKLLDARQAEKNLKAGL